MAPTNRIPGFSRSVWLTLSLFALLIIAFTIYTMSEKRIDRANELRHLSFQLADELRHSSDDLTRMARTYVVTGDPIYKKHYQDILDIRDGKKARPEKYQDIYWDLVPADGKPPRPDSGQAVALLTLMRRAGFTPEEFRKLEQAKRNSDALTATEFEAMRLVESGGFDAGADRAKARLMLHDERYHQAKAAIMGPIHDFNELMDQRTLAAVHAAESKAAFLRGVFALLGLGLMFALWRNYAVLRATLGGTADDVRAQIARIGSGDFSSAIPVAMGMKNVRCQVFHADMQRGERSYGATG